MLSSFQAIGAIALHVCSAIALHVCSVTKSCPTLCNPTDCSLPGSSGKDIPGKNTGVGFHVLLQGIIPTPGSYLCLLLLLHWQTESLLLSHLGSPTTQNIITLSHWLKERGDIYSHFIGSSKSHSQTQLQGVRDEQSYHLSGAALIAYLIIGRTGGGCSSLSFQK